MKTEWIQFSYCFEDSHLQLNKASDTEKIRGANQLAGTGQKVTRFEVLSF